MIDLICNWLTTYLFQKEAKYTYLVDQLIDSWHDWWFMFYILVSGHGKTHIWVMKWFGSWRTRAFSWPEKNRVTLVSINHRYENRVTLVSINHRYKNRVTLVSINDRYKNRVTLMSINHRYKNRVTLVSINDRYKNRVTLVSINDRYKNRVTLVSINHRCENSYFGEY